MTGPTPCGFIRIPGLPGDRQHGAPGGRGAAGISGDLLDGRERGWTPAVDVVGDNGFLRRERRYGSLSRSMALPAGVDAKKIKAKTSDGVVEVTIPLPKQPEKRKIEITPTAT